MKRWAEHVINMDKMKNAHKILFENLKRTISCKVSGKTGF